MLKHGDRRNVFRYFSPTNALQPYRTSLTLIRHDKFPQRNPARLHPRLNRTGTSCPSTCDRCDHQANPDAREFIWLFTFLVNISSEELCNVTYETVHNAMPNTTDDTLCVNQVRVCRSGDCVSISWNSG